MKPASQAEPEQAEPEPVALEAHRDPATGQVVYAAPHDLAVATRSGVTDLVLTPDGNIIATAPSDDGQPEAVSRIPHARMAATSWDEIAQALRNAEEGVSGGADVELRPGGLLLLSEPGNDPQPVSRLPQSRMAAANTGPSQTDVDELRWLDPANTERWSPVLTDLIAGWTFRLTPPISGQGQFVFFAFRSPSDGNAFWISVLRPDMDAEFGHDPHMIRAYVGGQEIPVICGPGGRPAEDLAEVRTHAAKWMAYTSRRMAGLNPEFSL